MIRDQALAVIQHPEFFQRIESNVTVGTDGPMSPQLGILLHSENTIAQTSFCRRAQYYIGSGSSQSFQFIVVEVSSVNKVKALVHRQVFQQPLHWSLATVGETITYFFFLFGNMKMKWQFFRPKLECFDDILKGYGAQRMDAKTKLRMPIIFNNLESRFQQSE